MSDYAMAHHPDLEMSIVQVSAVSNLPDYCYQFNPVPMLLLNKPAVIFQYPGSIVGEWEEEYVTWNGAELKVIFRPTLRKSDFVDVLWQQLFQGFDEPTAKFMGFEPTAITLPGRPSDYFFSPIPD